MTALRRTIFVLIISGHIFAQGKRPFTMEIADLNYEFNKNVVEDFYLKVFPYRKSNAFNGSMKLRRDVQEFYVRHWTTSIRRNGRVWTVYNVSVNGCDVLENKAGRQNPIAGAVIKTVRDLIINIPKKCPLSKTSIYSIINFYLNEDILPFFVPFINFKATFHVLTKTDYVFRVNVVAAIKSDKE